MEDEDVIGNDASQPVVPEKGQGKDETVTISKSEIESLRRELKETRDSERTWAAMAQRGAPPAQEPEADAEEDLDASQFENDEDRDVPADDTPEKLVEQIAAKGSAALKDRGFVTAADARRLAVEAATAVSRELIGRERQKNSTDTQIMSEFPDLRDKNSELFKETAARFQKAVALDPKAVKTPAALYLAAQAAKESLERKAASSRRNDDEDESERQLRARSQDGRTRGRGDVQDVDDMMGSEAKAVIAGMGISPEEWKAQKQELAGSRGRSRR